MLAKASHRHKQQYSAKEIRSGLLARLREKTEGDTLYSFPGLISVCHEFDFRSTAAFLHVVYVSVKQEYRHGK